MKYQLRTLGEPALLTPAGRPVPFRTRKALGLLTYLAVEARLHDREALAELFWARTGGAEARHSLSNAISEIRHRLGRASVEAVGERIRLRPDVVILDLTRLLAGRVLATDTEPQLEVDGFLEQFDLPDAIGFSHWQEAKRASLIPPLRDALVILVDRARRTGDFPALGRLGDRLVRFDELSEDAVRARMESRAFAGDRLGALRLFEAWKVELAAQLGAVPSPLLEGMALRLRRRGWERPDAADVPAVRMDHWRDRPFVARGAQFQDLYEAWESTRDGRPRHRLLLGESGIGKSTLVERITSAAALEGATVVRAQCHEAERELPYAAVSELITQLVGRSGAGGAPPEQLAELAQHIPAVRRRFPALPEPLATQGEAARVRFSEATEALMRAVAEEHPLLVVVDDVHNGDDVSMAVLHYVLRHEAGQPIQMLFVGRPSELKRSPNAARLLDHGERLGIETLPIPPLTLEETAELLQQLLEQGEEPGVAARRALVTASAGYPLVLELLLRDWRQSGNGALALQLDAIVPVPERRPAPVETYRLVLDRVFAALEPDTRTVLHTAAILGPHLNEPAMFALADVTASQMMHGLARLTELRILRDGGTGLEFANDLVRGQAYLTVPLALRQLLHGRVADELIRRAERGEPADGLDIAWHCIRSGRTEQAMHHLLEGARSAIHRGAVHEAEFRLGSALDQFTGERRVEAMLVLTELLQEQARWDESLEVLGRSPEANQTTRGRLQRAIAGVRTLSLPAERLTEAKQLATATIENPNSDSRSLIHALRLTNSLFQLHLRTDAADSALRDLIASRASDDSTPSDARVEFALSQAKTAFNLGCSTKEREELLVLVED
ncbi:MAG: AAA family ATPase, partial [Gemmatimonadales bacterium]|nr:AAA family ATPase [Gemmatimonadales bacterium]